MSADFIDSNVLVYLFDETDSRKYAVAERLVRDGLDGKAAISYQVVQETLNVLTRKLPNAATPEHARAFLAGVLEPLWRVMPSPGLFRRGLEISERYGYSFYNSMIIAAALQAGSSRLYSEDLQHTQRIEGLTILNPFAA